MITWTPPFAGGSIYSYLEECIKYLKQSASSSCYCTINEVTIIVYRESYISDLCDKFDMARKIKYKQY